MINLIHFVILFILSFFVTSITTTIKRSFFCWIDFFAYIFLGPEDVAFAIRLKLFYLIILRNNFIKSEIHCKKYLFGIIKKSKRLFLCYLEIMTHLFMCLLVFCKNLRDYHCGFILSGIQTCVISETSFQ